MDLPFREGAFSKGKEVEVTSSQSKGHTKAAILILEDDPGFGPLLCSYLEGEGYTVSLHTNATSALAYLEDNHVDLVITDLLIRQDATYVQDGGIKLISTLKQLRKYPAPVIAISGSFSTDQYEAISTAMTVGADKTLAKPINPSQLLTMIQEFVG